MTTVTGALLLPLRGADLPAVRKLASAVGIDLPAVPTLAAELARPHVAGRVLRPGPGEPVAGFVWYWVLADGAEIMHIAVAETQARRGFGRALMRDAMASAQRHGADQMRLEVRASNTAAIALYTGLGFDRVGLRPRYYSDNGEDAVLMCAPL